MGKKRTPKTKTYSKKRYNLGRIRETKSSANKVAKSYREEGYAARVSPKYSNGYGIYVRKKR